MTDEQVKDNANLEQQGGEAAEEVSLYETSQVKLIWRRFKKHKVAYWMMYAVIVLYAVSLSAPFLAPYDPVKIHKDNIDQPPQVVKIGMVDGYSIPRFYVNPFIMEQDPYTLQRQYYVDKDTRLAVEFFVEGRSWNVFGLFETNRHFYGLSEKDAAKGHVIFLLGSGSLGQDVASRMLYGGRISLLLGLTGVILTFVLGIVLGGVSGYYGGKIDMAIQRLAEILQSVPKIPIWLALAAAIPKNWTSLEVYFAMTIILACMAWTGMCRTVRGKLLSLREEDYAKAAMLAGASEKRVIFIHLVPNFMSHIIASLTLRIPAMILAETGLSFLGLGIRPPMVSLGVLLQETKNVSVVSNQPWMLLPALMVIITVLAFNFAGDGLRDAADPYAG